MHKKELSPNVVKCSLTSHCEAFRSKVCGLGLWGQTFQFRQNVVVVLITFLMTIWREKLETFLRWMKKMLVFFPPDKSDVVRSSIQSISTHENVKKVIPANAKQLHCALTDNSGRSSRVMEQGQFLHGKRKGSSSKTAGTELRKRSFVWDINWFAV